MQVFDQLVQQRLVVQGSDHQVESRQHAHHLRAELVAVDVVSADSTEQLAGVRHTLEQPAGCEEGRQRVQRRIADVFSHYYNDLFRCLCAMSSITMIQSPHRWQSATYWNTPRRGENSLHTTMCGYIVSKLKS